MGEIYYEFTDLDSDEAFSLLGKSLGGVQKNNTLYFNNEIAEGELVKSVPHPGLWIRKWKFTVFQKIILHKIAAADKEEKKFVLIYFLNPVIFSLKTKRKKISVSGARNNLFLTGDVTIDFSVVPKQPFYVLDIAFTVSWLKEQFCDANTLFKKILNEYISSAEIVLAEPCSAEEYKILRQLEVSMLPGNEDTLFVRSRVYNLIISFFGKAVNRRETKLLQNFIQYEQMMQAEKMIMENMKELPKVDIIAKSVNMSVSSLLRQFKLIYGKSIYEYYVEKKMEFAKKMLLESKMNVKDIAEKLGYKQASSFIEIFSREYGYSPGSVKLVHE